jgi:hypothetical protein
MGAPAVVEWPQGLAVGDILAAVEQGCDALGVDREGSNFVPQPLTHGRIGQFELGSCQLAHQQKHQLLLLAFGKGAVELEGHR